MLVIGVVLAAVGGLVLFTRSIGGPWLRIHVAGIAALIVRRARRARGDSAADDPEL